MRNVAQTVQTEPRARRIATANLPPGTEQIVHFRHEPECWVLTPRVFNPVGSMPPAHTYSEVIKMEMHAFGAGEVLTELVL